MPFLRASANISSGSRLPSMWMCSSHFGSRSISTWVVCMLAIPLVSQPRHPVSQPIVADVWLCYSIARADSGASTSLYYFREISMLIGRLRPLALVLLWCVMNLAAVQVADAQAPVTANPDRKGGNAAAAWKDQVLARLNETRQ